jgi:hypothetical protein
MVFSLMMKLIGLPSTTVEKSSIAILVMLPCWQLIFTLLERNLIADRAGHSTLYWQRQPTEPANTLTDGETEL